MSEVIFRLSAYLDVMRALLIEKGVVTEQEFDDRLARVISLGDQYMAAEREKVFAEMGPLGEMFRKVLDCE